MTSLSLSPSLPLIPAQLRPEDTEGYINYLISIGKLDEAAIKVAEIVNSVSLTSWALEPFAIILNLIFQTLASPLSCRKKLIMSVSLLHSQDKFVSKEGKSKHQLWQELCLLISKNPDKVNHYLASYTEQPSRPPPPSLL